MAIGSVRQFKAEIKDTFNNPVSITPTLQWASSDPAIATVSATGLVTAVKEGSTQITVTDVDSKRSATATVAVNLPIITITPDTLLVSQGSSVQLNATATDLQGNPITTPTLVWASNNTEVTVSNTGLVTAASTAKGEAVITAKDPASGAIDTVIVKLELLNLNINAFKYSSRIYDLTAVNKGGTVAGVIWTSDNPKVTFSNSRLTAAPDVDGTVIVTATDPSSGAKGTTELDFKAQFEIIGDYDNSYIHRKTAIHLPDNRYTIFWSKLISFKVVLPKDSAIYVGTGPYKSKIDCGSWTQEYSSYHAAFSCTRNAFMPVSTTITFQVASVCGGEGCGAGEVHVSFYPDKNNTKYGVPLSYDGGFLNGLKVTILPSISFSGDPENALDFF